MKLGFTLHWVGSPPRIYTTNLEHSRCEAVWRAIRNHHTVTNGWSDIAYSFGACRHGEVFEGRGWHRNQFANGADVVPPYDGDDAHWYSICVFLGTDDDPPTNDMVDAVHTVVAQGRAQGMAGLRVLPHSAFKPKPCPGPHFSAWAAYWDLRPFPPKPQEDDMPVACIPSWSPVLATGRRYQYETHRAGPHGVRVVARNGAPLNLGVQGDRLVWRVEVIEALGVTTADLMVAPVGEPCPPVEVPTGNIVVPFTDGGQIDVARKP